MKKIYILILVILLTSCAKTRYRGYYMSDEDIQSLKVGLTSAENTIKILGEPSLRLEEDEWLYYSYKTSKIAFARPKIKEEQVLLVYFDENDTIADIQYSIRKKPTLHFIKEKTKKTTKGNFFKELLSNVGVSAF